MMNIGKQLIQELSEQAKKYARSHVADCERYGYYMEDNEFQLRFEEKFAELIVNECIKCAEWEVIRNGDTEHNRACGKVRSSMIKIFWN